MKNSIKNFLLSSFLHVKLIENQIIRPKVPQSLNILDINQPNINVLEDIQQEIEIGSGETSLPVAELTEANSSDSFEEKDEGPRVLPNSDSGTGTVTVFSNSVNANISASSPQDLEIPNPIEGKKLSALIDMIYGVTNTVYSRKVLSTMVQNYGCHCFTDNSRIPGGKGKPVDAQDSLCRKLSQCYSCLNIDYNSNTSTCDPSSGKYRYQIDGTLKTITCQDAVEKNSVHACRRNSCECDKAFALEFAKIWDDGKFNRYYWKNKFNLRAGNPTFDKDDVCQVSTVGSAERSQCCGGYPERKPYNIFLFECCEDQKARPVGTC